MSDVKSHHALSSSEGFGLRFGWRCEISRSTRLFLPQGETLSMHLFREQTLSRKKRRDLTSDGAHLFVVLVLHLVLVGSVPSLSGGVAAARSGLFYGV